MHKIRLKIEIYAPVKNPDKRALAAPRRELAEVLYLETERSFVPFPGLRMNAIPGISREVTIPIEGVTYDWAKDLFDVKIGEIDQEQFLYLKSVPHHFGWQLAIGEW